MIGAPQSQRLAVVRRPAAAAASIESSSWRRASRLAMSRACSLKRSSRNCSRRYISIWLQRLNVRRRDAEQIAAAVTVGPRIVERLSDQEVEPAEVVSLADRYAPDAPLFALATADLQPLHEYFRGLRDIRLEVTGSDLAELGR